jgi:hypothetical protein
MANVVSIQFQIDQDQQGRVAIRQIDSGIDKIGQTAKQSGAGIESFVGFFKTAIIFEFFRRGVTEAIEFGKQAVEAFNKAQSAALGLQSVAKFKGIGGDDALAAVKNLDLVKSGLLSIGDASTTLKNLLQSGFSLDESIILLQRFGDSAAFGRQQALTFGQAIVSTSEGVRNQNCVTGDTLVLTTDGEIPIQEIVNGKLNPLVISFNKENLSFCTKPITGLARNGIREVYELKLSDGNRIKATPNHRFMTSRGMKFLFDIKEGDEVYTWSEIACDVNRNSKSQQTESIQQSIVPSDALMKTEESESRASNAVSNTLLRKVERPKVQDFAQEIAKGVGVQSISSVRMPSIIEMAATVNRSSSSARFATRLSSKSLTTSRKGSGTYAQKSVEIKFVLSSLERLVPDIEKEFKLFVSGAVNPSDSFLASPEIAVSVLRLAAMNGKAKCGCEARIARCGMAALPDGAQASWQRESIKTGARKSIGAIPIPANIAEISGAEISTRTISNPLLSILNWQQWRVTGSRSAKIVTPNFIKKRRPSKAKVLSVKRVGFEQVYDLEIEDTHTFIGNSILQSNSILSDNGGITKNLSVILKERGFELQDLSDKLKGAAAREALYNGLLKETQAQVGDAGKLTTTFAGQTAKLEAEQQKLLVAVGAIITRNPELAASIDSLSKSIEIVISKLQDSNSELSQFVEFSTTAFAAFVRGGSELLANLDSIIGKLRELQAFGVAGGLLKNVFGVEFGEGVTPEFLESVKKIRELFSQGLKGVRGDGGATASDALIPSKKDRQEFEKFVKDAQKQNEQLFKHIRDAGDAAVDLNAKLQVNPVARVFDDANKRLREFSERFPDVGKKLTDAFSKANQEVLALDIFKGTLGQAGALNRLLSERAKISEGGALFQGIAQREVVDNQLRQAQEFLGLATNAAQKQLALENILGLTSGPDLSGTQKDVRRRALDESIAIQGQVFKENFERLKNQTAATQDNTGALVQVGNRLAQVDGALTNFVQKPITIIVEDASSNFQIDLGR